MYHVGDVYPYEYGVVRTVNVVIRLQDKRELLLLYRLRKMETIQVRVQRFFLIVAEKNLPAG